MLITKRHLSRRTVLKGIGVTAALPLLEAMVPAATAQAKTVVADRQGPPRRHRDGARRRRQHRLRHEDEHVVAGRDRPRLRLDAERPGAARVGASAHHHREQHRPAPGRSVHDAGNRRRPLPRQRGVPHPGASEADDGFGRPRRHLARPAVRPARRQRDADPVDAALHRTGGSVGRLRIQLLLRLHRLDQLGRRTHAAADDSRPAHGVRSALRRRRHQRRAGAAPARRQEHPRRPGRVGEPSQGAGRRHRQGPPRRLPRGRPRNRTAHPEGRGVQLERPGARAARRADRRARLLRRARQADVRSAGAGLRQRHHARVRLQDEPRRLGPRLPDHRRHHRLPQRQPPQLPAKTASATSTRSTSTT